MSFLLSLLIQRNKGLIKINEYKKIYSANLPKEAFTFRINPLSKAIIEKNAELLEMSTGQFINLVIDEFIYELEISEKKNNESLLINKDNLLVRIKSVLDAHKIIDEKYFEFLELLNINLGDLINEDKLIEKFNFDFLRRFSDIFNISMTWLVGHTNSIYKNIYISKNTEIDELISKIIDTKSKFHSNGNGHGYFISDEEGCTQFVIYQNESIFKEYKFNHYTLIKIINKYGDETQVNFEMLEQAFINLEKKGIVTCSKVSLGDRQMPISNGNIFIEECDFINITPWNKS